LAVSAASSSAAPFSPLLVQPRWVAFDTWETIEQA
jgi:hypothetical protein